MPNKLPRSRPAAAPKGKALARALASVSLRYPETPEGSFDLAAAEDSSAYVATPDALPPPRLHWQDDARGFWLYHGDCLTVMDTIAAKHPLGCFDLIFVDPPYFLANGGKDKIRQQLQVLRDRGLLEQVERGFWQRT